MQRLGVFSANVLARKCARNISIRQLLPNTRSLHSIPVWERSNNNFDLKEHGIQVERVHRNRSVGELYELGTSGEKTTTVTSVGALSALSAAKTGRSPKDKRIVDEPSSNKDVWWGKVNMKLPESSYELLKQDALNYLNQKEEVYVVDGFANWDPKNRVKIRVICARAYHALFMRNMLIRPTQEEQKSFGKPDFVIYNAGQFPANVSVPGVTSDACISVHFGKNEMVILGSQYAGEMKKGVFTVMHYLAPKKGLLSLHSSANEGPDGDVSLFFGLSGTGKTTLSADPKRALIGDDEHIWTEQGVFNIEGGCYAKCVNLSVKTEPEIFNAIRFGSVLENVIYNKDTRVVDYTDVSITENTRACYPIEYINNAKIPCMGGHPKNIIFLTCDAFGVLPPVSRLSPEQAMYHFIAGYTSKMAGTEVGVKDPQVTFSACFGEAFLVRHPAVYAELLADKMKKHKANAWLVNTGWTGGGPGVGQRMSLKHTRSILDAIHATDGKGLANSKTTKLPIFNLDVPTECRGVPSEILVPRKAWKDGNAYDQQLKKLGSLFIAQFENYKDQASKATSDAGPQV